MNRTEFRELLQRWCLEDAEGQNGIEELKRDVEYLERELYDDYVVTAHGDHGAFGSRLARWIGNLDSDEDRQSLYRILAHIFFIGKSEQEAAYRTAFSKHVLQWLMKVSDTDPFAVDVNERMNAELAATRFTEVTDSFGIRPFCLLNNIQTEALRYKWEGNTENWSSAGFRREVLRENCPGETPRTNLVLMEDFVGSGSQMLNAVRLAVSLGNDINVLLCPLFICPDGVRAAMELSDAYTNFTFSPVLAFEDRFFISPEPKAGENADFQRIRSLIVKIHPKIEGIFQEYGPFGYRQTGGLIVPYSNSPDNTIPAIHRKKNDSWEPLFLRSTRLPI